MVYNFHHPKPPDKADIKDGFLTPFDLIVAGWSEWKATGVVPNPDDLARRINSRFYQDLQNFDRAIELGRPKSDTP